MSKGVVVMIHELFGDGNQTVEAMQRAIGQKIVAIAITEKKLVLTMADGFRLKLFDDGQCCCEYRYMHTDDDLDYFVGAEFRGAVVQDGPTTEVDYETLETAFLIVQTSLGEFTVNNYNNHNGYYGGFALAAREDDDE